MQEPSDAVIAELGRRARSWRPRPPIPPTHGLRNRLEAPDLASIHILRERRDGDRCAVALTVADGSGQRYRVIRELVRKDDQWRTGGGFEGVDRWLPGKPDPYVSLGAFYGSSFWAAGTVQSTDFDVDRVRLVWDDGQVLEDRVANGVVFFFGLRESPDPATAEFLDRDGRLIATHVTLIDEQDPPAARRSHADAGAIEVMWRELNELTHVAVVDGTVAGVLYAERASDGGHDRCDLCWLSSERADETHVLFGASELHADAWATRWDRAHVMVERFLRRAPSDPSSASREE